jgi:hypothetical protein
MGGVTNNSITTLGCKKLWQGEILSSAPRNALTHNCAPLNIESIVPLLLIGTLRPIAKFRFGLGIML